MLFYDTKDQGRCGPVLAEWREIIVQLVISLLHINNITNKRQYALMYDEARISTKQSTSHLPVRNGLAIKRLKHLNIQICVFSPTPSLISGRRKNEVHSLVNSIGPFLTSCIYFSKKSPWC